MISKSFLPSFVEPMLARPGQPFDSEDHQFEVKWDGTRALSFIDQDGLRIRNRRKFDITERYPDLSFLSDLPAGTVLDGELVVLDEQGKPSFPKLQTREQARSPLKLRTLATSTPATYIVFDQIYDRFHCIMDYPLQRRLENLSATVDRCGHQQLVQSEAIRNNGTALYDQVMAQGLEGVVAKRLNSRYQPGKRTDAWIKIKRREDLICAIIGFVPKGRNDFESLILAADHDGLLRCVGKVGTGFTTKMRQHLNGKLRDRLADMPLVRCTIAGQWVEPCLYCRIRFMERTRSGDLRDPVFEQLLEE